MRIVVGDEVGQVKVVTFHATPSNEVMATDAGRGNNSKRNRTIIDEGQDEINGKTDKKTTKKLAPPFKTNSLIATQNRDRAITLFCWANSNMSKVAAATHNGKVLIIDVETGAIDNEIPVFQYIKPKASVAGNKVAEEEHFIGLHVAQGSNSNLPTVSTNVGQDALVVMRVFHDSPEYFATGGAERDLALWRAIDDKDTGTAKLENIWKAKNVPNTYLDLRVPVHITDIQFLPPLRTVPSIESVLKHNDKKSDGKKEESAIKPGRIAIVSLHKHYRIYDVSIGKRQPVLSVEVGDMPPKKLALTANGTQGIVTDTTGAALLIDSETGSRVGAFKGFHGTITDMVCATEHNEDGEKGLFITVGIDRMLRVYERDAKRRLLHQIYLKQRLHSVLVDETYVAPVQEGSKKLSSKIEKKSNKNSKVIDDEEDVDFWVRMQTEGASDDEEEIAEEAPVALERKFKTKKRRV
ncbi:WD repeat-containing protein 74 [Physocladia obscura]|uniref:Ribosome biogenesis protein NSA1 n=1 Tax=Physocladia obscura TaxID=109957 RepID=A0AAD5T6M6_9FUNG|nr:WD repeat-containing protein 74 [Physocladia obscura]